MPSNNKTEHLGLNKWESNEYVKRQDFVDDNEEIDKAFKELKDSKVDKVEGKELSTNDYTNGDKSKLAAIQSGANKYTHPSSHPASMITGLHSVATSGNADTVDGLHASSFLRSDIDDTINGNLTLIKGKRIKLHDSNSIGSAIGMDGENFVIWEEEDGDRKMLEIKDDGDAFIYGNKVLTVANEGHGKGIDADTLDGIHISGIVKKQEGILNSDIDLNNLTKSGFYRVQTGHANMPSEVGHGQLIVACGGGDTVTQIITGYRSEYIFFRSGNPLVSHGYWSSWRKIWHEGNDGKDSGLDADLWRGWRIYSELSQLGIETGKETMNEIVEAMTDFSMAIFALGSVANHSEYPDGSAYGILKIEKVSLGRAKLTFDRHAANEMWIGTYYLDNKFIGWTQVL